MDGMLPYPTLGKIMGKNVFPFFSQNGRFFFEKYKIFPIFFPAIFPSANFQRHTNI